MRRVVIIAGVALVLGLGVALALYGGPAPDVLLGLGLGWAAYLARVVPQVKIAWDGVVTGVFCLALFTVGLHQTLTWLHGEVQKSGRAGAGAGAERARAWSLRWTVALVALIVMMFLVGIAAAGVVHQVGWLIASRRSLVEEKPRYRDVYGSSTDHLKQIGSASALLDLDPQPPPWVTRQPEGEVPQSWMTEILPGTWFMLGGELRRDRPWDDPGNSAYFKGVVPFYLNPEVRVLRSPRGYALSHYAGNVHVLGRDRATRRVGPGDAANTILAGEVAEGFKPWGDPTNLRDPGLGVNKVSGGFGGPSRSGANFLFVDGSVRFLQDTISREVLRRLSLPRPADP
jgi:prepilin-type processing-associated H-X9-DG protein